MKYIEGVGEMPNSQAGDVEALRRELADLVVQWAGKSVKDDPDSPLGAALTRAVREAAREAVADQHQALNRRDAEGIAEAVERLRSEQQGAGGMVALPQKTAIAVAAVAFAVVVLAFVIGLQLGRAGSAADTAAAEEPALAAAPVAPLAAPGAATPRVAPNVEIAPPAAEAQPRAAAPVRAAAARPEPTPAKKEPAPVKKAQAPARAGRPAPAAVGGDTGGQPVTGARAPAATPPSPAPQASAP